MKRGGILGAALALAMAGALLPGSAGWAQTAAETARVRVATAAPQAVLIDQDGRRFPLAQLRGKAVLVAFIYTSCHHVCPLIFESVRAVQARVASQGVRGVFAVFVTVDPEIDTPEVLRAYARRRGADLATTVFLTGSDADLVAVWDGFGVKVKRLGRGLIDHPPVTFLVDPQSVVCYRYYGGVLDTETVVADLRGAVQAAAK